MPQHDGLPVQAHVTRPVPPGSQGKGWRQGQEPAVARGSTGKVNETGEQGPAFISGTWDLHGSKRCH